MSPVLLILDRGEESQNTVLAGGRKKISLQLETFDLNSTAVWECGHTSGAWVDYIHISPITTSQS